MLDFVQCSTDAYSKLPKILWLKTIHIFISQSVGQKSKQVPLRSLVKISVYQNRGVGQTGPFSGLWGRFHLQDPSGCWQNSDPMAVRLRFQQSCWLSASNGSPLLQPSPSLFPTPPWGPSIFNQHDLSQYSHAFL